MKWLWFVGAAWATVSASSVAWAQSSSYNVNQQVARLTADVQRLQQQLGSLNIAVEQLQRENATLRQELQQRDTATSEMANAYVTTAQLNRALSELRSQMIAANESQKSVIIREVTAEINSLAKQTQTALDAMARAGASRPQTSAPVTFSDDFPKSGVSYTVKGGDSLGKIARENKSRVDWIRNANRLASDIIYPGQELFIPQQ
ncbi:MAG: LysM peptidoglycan-binding domain-containing protein [Verrucomicrobiota bacterium JB022]|nr:LysM peptidoglycan-binding domain-containing protein [Verrucomicrobiota bacterium JB022]